METNTGPGLIILSNKTPRFEARGFVFGGLELRVQFLLVIRRWPVAASYCTVTSIAAGRNDSGIMVRPALR